VLARAVLAAWGALPLAVALFFGRVLGALAFVLDGGDRRRAIAQASVALALSPVEARLLVRAMFRHLGLVVAELAAARRVRARFVDYVDFPAEDEARLRAALADGGRGVVGVTAHLGNWELLAQRVAYAGIPMVTFARRNPNPDLGDWLVRERTAGGVETIERGGGAGGGASGVRILRSLRRGALLAALIDQDTRVPSVFVPFFGRPAATPSGPAELALRAKVPVIAGFITRTPTGHRVSIERLSIADLPGATDAERAAALTARMTEAIERAVRAAPEQWVWFHQRWKRQPPAD
jgi:KDO2-lipid IV(A) lauroyltransferase